MAQTTLVQLTATTTITNSNNIIYPLDILDIFEKELPHTDFVFRGLKTGTLGFLTSAGGAGKSMLAIQLAISLADTTKQYNFYPFVNSKTKRGKIIYIYLEDPIDIIAKRVKRILNFLIEHKNRTSFKTNYRGKHPFYKGKSPFFIFYNYLPLSPTQHTNLHQIYVSTLLLQIYTLALEALFLKNKHHHKFPKSDNLQRQTHYNL